jgi:hypothetical protein
MGWSFRSTKTLPDRYSIIGSPWPLDERPDEPGPAVRPCLVLDSWVQFDDELQVEYGVVRLCYGSKQATEAQLQRDMFVGPKEYNKGTCRLHYPTRFSMDRIEEFVWCKEWFPSHRYIINRLVTFGYLQQHQIDRFQDCLMRWQGAQIT